jgi:xanthine dehydrogenase large subunit
MTIAGTPLPHESSRGHVTGDALYTDDLVNRFPNLLHAWPVLAPHAHAMVTLLDPSGALQERGVVAVLTDADVPGEGNSGRTGMMSRCFPPK